MESNDCVPGGLSWFPRRFFSAPRSSMVGALALVLTVSQSLAAWAGETNTTATPTTTTTNAGTSFSGNVSWYGGQFNGRKTASGEIFDIKKFTAAHRKLPFGTKILIENPRTGKTVVVKVNDRGPYAKGRVLDLSRGAAEKLGILLGGVAFVECTVLGKDGAGPSSMNKAVIGYLPEEHFVALAVNTTDSESSCQDVSEDDCEDGFASSPSMLSLAD